MRESARISGPLSRLLGSLPNRRAVWLATQCLSHLSLGKFPANREFYRESGDLAALRPDDWPENTDGTAPSEPIPFAN